MSELAELVYKARAQNNHKRNFTIVDRIFDENSEVLNSLLERCPRFHIILAFLLEDRFGWASFRIGNVDSKVNMKDWNDKDCERIGKSFGASLSKCDSPEAAVEEWRAKFSELDTLFVEVEQFEEFMLIIAKNLNRDQKWD